MAACEDDELERIKARDPEVVSAFVRNHMPNVRRVARRILGARADLVDDASQATFMAALRSLDTFRGDCPLEAWLRRIAANEALRVRKKAQKDAGAGDDLEHLQPKFMPVIGRLRGSFSPWTRSPEEVAASAEARDVVRQKIQQLPERYRDVLLLRDIEELSTEETAEALGITAGNVKVRLHRARNALRALLTDFVEGDRE